jgi:DNA-directed RNA polymerase I subunit RPA43
LCISTCRLNGVLVAYKNVKLKEACGTVIGDDPLIYAVIVADLIVFRPVPGRTLEVVINKIGRDHIGCLVHSCFNASAGKPVGIKADALNVGDWVLLDVDQILPVNGVLAIAGNINEKRLV